MRIISTKKLKVTSPFDLSHSIRFANKFPVDFNKNDGQYFLGSTKYQEEVIVYGVKENNDSVQLQILSEDRWSRQDRDHIAREISHYLSLEDNLSDFYDLADRDPVFKSIKNALYGYHQIKFTTPFKAACWAIISARNHWKRASAQMNQIIMVTDGILYFNGVQYMAFPEPEDFLQIPEDRLIRELGEKKTGYLLNVTDFFLEFGLDKLQQMSTEHLYDNLENIVGIGQWGAGLIAIRGLGRMEDLRSPEKRLQQIVKRMYNNNNEKHANHYGTFKGYWAHYLRYWDDLYTDSF